MRDTPYARELITASFEFPDHSEGRIERLFVKPRAQEEIRFSWWKAKRMLPRPLDATEEQLLTLLKNAIKAGIFSENFRRQLKPIL